MFLAGEINVLNALNYFIYLTLFIAIFFGFLRGGKKSIYILITMVVFFILYFVTLDAAVNFLWTYDMPQLAPALADIHPDLANFTNIEGSLGTFLEVGLGGQIDLTSSSAEVTVLATQIGKFVVKLVWTLVYFTVVLLVYRIVMWFIGLFIVAHKKGQDRQRLVGAIAGGLNGLLSVYVLIVMLGGIHSMTESAIVLMEDTSTPEMAQVVQMGDETPFNPTLPVIPMSEPTDPLPEDAMQSLIDFNESYNNNFFVKMASAIKANSIIDETVKVPAHINLFDRVFSFDYNEQVIALRYEIDVLGQAGLVIMSSDYAETSEITDITGADIREVFVNLGKSQLISSLAPVAIEVAADMNDITLNMTKDELYAIDYSAEIANLGAIGGALFDIFNGAGIIDGSGDYTNLTVDGNTVRDVFEDVSESDIILLMTDAILLPMLEDSEGDFSTVITVPDDLDLEAEFLALGSIAGEIIDAQISFADLESGEPSILLDAVSEVDLTILKDSQLVSNALINIFSGAAELEGFDFIETPTGLVWEDDGVVEGELTKILRSLNVLSNLSSSIDFENFSVSSLDGLTSTQINTFFDSYVLRATVSEFVKEMDLDDTPLIFPSTIYDAQNYFIKSELVSLVESANLIVDSTSGEFDPINALSLTTAEIQTLLGSQIIHATISDIIVDQGSDNGGPLHIPDVDVLGVDLHTQVSGIDYISKAEITNILQALNAISITDFDSIDFEDTSLLVNNFDQLIDSSIVQATVSDIILDLDGTLVIPETDVLNSDILIYQGSTTYIEADELEAITDVISLMGIANPTQVTTNVSLATFANGTNQDTLLASAIMHATVSNTLLDYGDTILLVPHVEEDDTPVRLEVGPLGSETEYIAKQEIKDMLTALNAMNFTDINSFTGEIDTTKFLDNTALVLESATLQATISDIILSSTAVINNTLMVPDYEYPAGVTEIRVDKALNSDVMISKAELTRFFESVNELSITNFDTFDFDPQAMNSTSADVATLLDSYIMQATASKYLLDVSGDEDDPAGTTTLLVPTTSREDIDVNGVTIEQIEKLELINIFEVFEYLGMNNFNDPIDPITVQNLTRTQIIDDVLVSKSFHVTVDNMLRGNPTPGFAIPNIAKASFYSLSFDLTTKQEVADLVVGLRVATGGIGGFNSAVISYAGIAGLSKAQRDDIVHSLTIRQFITSDLEAINLADPLYPDFVPADYEATAPGDPTILTYTATVAALDNYGA